MTHDYRGVGESTAISEANVESWGGSLRCVRGEPEGIRQAVGPGHELVAGHRSLPCPPGTRLLLDAVMSLGIRLGKRRYAGVTTLRRRTEHSAG